MTPEEKKRYLGLNVTSMESAPEHNVLKTIVGKPSKLLWTDKGKVTPVKDQGSRGSCWTFGAVFEGRDDGCDGGWVDVCYEWSAKYGGRLAASRDYPYKQRDGRCYYNQKPNAMKAYKITGAINVGRSEAAHIDVLQTASIGVAFEVTDLFFQYGK